MVVNKKLERVMKGLTECAEIGCSDCPYKVDLSSSCIRALMVDARDCMEAVLTVLDGYSARLDEQRAYEKSLQQKVGEGHAEK